MAFQEDLAWFEANRQFIASQYPNQYVVVKDGAVRGAYPTYEQAFAAAAAMFGAQQVVVQQATAAPRTAVI